MKVVRDPIHGNIELDELALSLIDTPSMQRLRRVRQLGLSNLVYPGANHTRFEHSIGVMHLTSMISKMDSISNDEMNELRAAALIHDIGHGPLSHLSEGIIELYTKRKHDDIKYILKKDEISDILNKYGLNPTTISNHIKGNTALGQILNSEIDVDRMDYLIRDAHYTGVAYSIVDHVRLIQKLKLYGDKLIIASGGLNAAESLLVSRFLMHPSVYYHHVSRIAETMCKKAIIYLIEKKTINPFELKSMDDGMLFSIMHQDDGYAKEIVQRLDERKLYKRALYAGFDTVDKTVLEFRDNIERIEKEIADMVGIEPEAVLIDIPKKPEIAELKALIEINGKMVSLNEASSLVATLELAHESNWKMGVYTKKIYREDVKKAAFTFFEVKKTTKQVHFR